MSAMSPQHAPGRLVGRASELARVEAIIRDARNGRSGVLVLHGEAGIGKTALLEAATEIGADLGLARIAGVESEGALGFAGLHRLLVPFLDRASVLPARQRSALDAALGLDDAASPDRFLVGLAALTILCDAASDSHGLLLVIDDGQWIDQESLDAISFVARRLHADRIAILMAFRDETIESAALPDGLPALAVEGLSEDDTRSLLRAVSTGPLNEQVETRVASSVAGSPLAVLELARVLSDEQLLGSDLLPDPLPVGERLESHFLQQVHRLPDTTQRFVLLAAAEPSGDAALVWRAAEELGLDRGAGDAAELGGLLAIGSTIEFRHPLIRSAVYRGSAPADRRLAHRALADAIVDDAEADRRAWHRAAAAVGPDEEVASDLERAAGRARTRGGHAAEGAFQTRAAELTPDRRRRAERYLAAAQANLTAGAPAAAAELIERAGIDADDALLSAQAQRVSAALQSYSNAGPAAALLLSAARSLEPIDVRRSRETYAEAIQAAMVSCQLTSGATLEEVARAVLDAPADPTGAVEASDLLMDGYATRLAHGHVAAAPILRSAMTTLSDDMTRATLDRWAVLGNSLPAELWEVEETARILRRLEVMERDRGAVESLRVTLGGRAHLEMWNGNFDLADALHSEASEIASALGEAATDWELLKVELWAWQGDQERTRFVADLLTGEVGHSYGAGVVVNMGRMALCILEQGLGNYRDAFEQAARVHADDIPPHGNQALPELIEAAVRCDELDAARRALPELEERVAASATPWSLGLLARSRALLTDGDEAEAQYHEALERFSVVPVRTDTARTHLLLGEWLRRRNRRSDARDHLRAASEMFQSMGAEAFAARAGAELAATGERVRRRSLDTVNELTPQESQIAALAADGATNREIATTLFISASTVDYHLRKVFRKLDVSSRRQLARELQR